MLVHPLSCSSVHRHRLCSRGLCISHFQKHSTGQLCVFGGALLPFPHCLLPIRKNSTSCSVWGHKRNAEQQLISLLLPLYVQGIHPISSVLHVQLFYFRDSCSSLGCPRAPSPLSRGLHSPPSGGIFTLPTAQRGFGVLGKFCLPVFTKGSFFFSLHAPSDFSLRKYSWRGVSCADKCCLTVTSASQCCFCSYFRWVLYSPYLTLKYDAGEGGPWVLDNVELTSDVNGGLSTASVGSKVLLVICLSSNKRFYGFCSTCSTKRYAASHFLWMGVLPVQYIA